MKLIVGLGNPGKEFKNTRHNMGFVFLDDYVNYKKLSKYKSKFNGLYTEFVNNGERVILLKPQMYINLSGRVIQKYLDYFNIDIDDLLVIHDDLDIEFGKYKVKASGSSAGHNGLKDIESSLNSQNYKRLKIGISRLAEFDMRDYVLSKFSKDDQKIIENLKLTVREIIDDFLNVSFSQVMNKYN